MMAQYTALYGLIRQVTLEIWLYTLPDRVQCAEITSVVIGESQSQSQVRPVRGRCANCGYQINWALIG